MSANENTTRHQKKKMLAALARTMGVVKTASDICGVPRSTHYRWMNSDSEYATNVYELANIPLDFAESKLHKLIEEGNVAAVIFYLKTKGKHRGYVEKIEQDHTFTGGDVVVESIDAPTPEVTRNTSNGDADQS